jgi:hypothetical protein
MRWVSWGIIEAMTTRMNQWLVDTYWDYFDFNFDFKVSQSGHSVLFCCTFNYFLQQSFHVLDILTHFTNTLTCLEIKN